MFSQYSDCIKYCNLEKIKELKNQDRPKLVAFTGASSSGKTYLAKLLNNILKEKSDYFSQDNYYRNFKQDFEKKYTLSDFYKKINFDDPIHFNVNKLKEDLSNIKKSNKNSEILLPKITFGTDTEFPFITNNKIELKIQDFIITEGVYAFEYPNEDIQSNYDLRIFVEMPLEVRKKTWMERNLKEGRYFNEHMWQTTIDAYENYILPAQKYADIIIYNTTPYKDFTLFFETIFEEWLPIEVSNSHGLF